MKTFVVPSVITLLAVGSAHAMPLDGGSAVRAGDVIQLAGNTSSNSSSNTSSNQSGGRSSVVRTHRWSIDSDDGRRRRVIGGITQIERYRTPERRRARHR